MQQNPPRQSGSAGRGNPPPPKAPDATKKKNPIESSSSGNVPDEGGVFVDIVCYNCGIPGHHQANCAKPKICFICKSSEHAVDLCPVRKQGHASARFLGSAASGLGFYYVEIPDVADQIMVDVSNYGKVYIDTGEILKEELIKEPATSFNANWPWQVRQLEDWSYLVRFHPKKKVKDCHTLKYFIFGCEYL